MRKPLGTDCPGRRGERLGLGEHRSIGQEPPGRWLQGPPASLQRPLRSPGVSTAMPGPGEAKARPGGNALQGRMGPSSPAPAARTAPA